MLLNLSINGQALHNCFLVIDIDLTSTQTFQTAFVACLNFNYDILQDTTFQNAGAYSCQYMDVNATQQQITQHLIVIKTSEQIFRNNSRAYLTIFYLENPNDFLSQNKQLKNPIDYVVATYYSSWYPCHNSCNNLNGSCNQKTGQCKCLPLYFNIDCSLEVNSLNFNQNYGQAEIAKHQQKTQYFFINLTQTVINNNQGHLTFQLNQINQIAKIDILINVNILNLPNEYQNNEKYVMSNQIMQIQNVDLLCSKYNNLNINDTAIVDDGDAQIENQCFLVLAIKQTMSQSQFSLVDIQLQFQTSSTQDNSNHKNQTIKIVKANLNNQTQYKQQQSQSALQVECVFQLFFQDQAGIKYLDEENKNNSSQQQKKERNRPSLSESQIHGKQLCSIYLVEFVKEKIRQKICNHTFHSQCLNNWLQKNDNCPICRQEFGINEMIEYITSKKLDLMSYQIKKNHINSIKEELLSKLQKKEIYELEGEQFLKYIQQNLIGQLPSDSSLFKQDDELNEQQKVEQDKNKIQFLKNIEQSSVQSKSQNSQFSPLKFQSRMLPESSPDNIQEQSTFNLMTSLNQDDSNKHLN
ncbi:hypothetical protein ABPG72_021903, partial [Tetrahymena utriculariae]